METCVEDDEIAERMDAGRKALMQRGDNEIGPYQSPMEDGMQHFHEWYRGRIGARRRRFLRCSHGAAVSAARRSAHRRHGSLPD